MKRAYERLIDYTKYETVSDELSEDFPSTPAQKVFGRALVEELREIGAADAHMDGWGYVYAKLPSNIPGWKGYRLAFLAHMDLSDGSPSQNVRPSVIEYTGGQVTLNEKLGVKLDPADDEELSGMVGKHLVVTDGRTLLGADNKAGIAEIMVMAETLISGNIPHGDITICFTPDEEVGRGTDHIDLDALAADIAYTADGETFGGVEYETFNAAAAKIVFHGVSTHTGTAKGTMVNAMLLACEYAALLPAEERPETTCGYQGFYHLHRMSGTVEEATLDYLIRDHDAERFEARKEVMKRAAERINERYGALRAEITVTDTYYNMREKIAPHMHLVDRAYEAIRSVGGEPFSEPIRGGTDGSALSYMGVPCPNLGTGSYNAHGRTEFACCEEMDAAAQALIYIARAYGQTK